MTLMDAEKYDPERDRRRRRRIVVVIVLALLAAWVVYHYRDYRERNVASKFFAALQRQNYEEAYGVWFRDPGWKQHPSQYSQVHVQRLLSGLGAGWRVGSDKVLFG